MNKFKPTTLDSMFLSASIILARAVNALMDAIMVVKAPRSMDLEYLWHGAKWAWMAFLILVGVFVWRHIGWLLFDRDLKQDRDVLIRFLVYSGFAIFTGEVVWRWLYQYWKTVEWWRFPWA